MTSLAAEFRVLVDGASIVWATGPPELGRAENLILTGRPGGCPRVPRRQCHLAVEVFGRLIFDPGLASQTRKAPFTEAVNRPTRSERRHGKWAKSVRQSYRRSAFGRGENVGVGNRLAEELQLARPAFFAPEGEVMEPSVRHAVADD